MRIQNRVSAVFCAVTLASELFLSVAITTPAGATFGPAIKRPLSDFAGAQGTSSLFFPPAPDLVGWANNPFTLFALVDYTGQQAAWISANGGPDLGTAVGGSVVERPLSDGTTMIHVALNAKNANTFALNATDFVFGYEPNDLVTDPSRSPALSNAQFRVDFTNTSPGAPLPDLVDAFILGNAAPGQSLRFLSFRSSGSGPLRSAYGVPDGTPGHLAVTQTGIFMTSFQGSTADGFPAETIVLQQVGQ